MYGKGFDTKCISFVDNMNKKKNNFIIQGSILGIAGILVRIIGLIYRIPLNNILGEAGIGYYSTVYDIYSFLLLISSLSLPLAVSKLVSARVGKGEHKNALKIFGGALLFATVTGLIVALVAFFGAGFLAQLYKIPSATLAIKVLAPTLVMVSMVGVIRGYFQGLGSMIPTAISQIIEQIANAIVSIVAAKQLYLLGTKIDLANGTTDLATVYSVAGGTLGTCLGAAAALAFLAFTYLLYRNNNARYIRKDKAKYELEYSEIMRLIVITVVPVLLSTTVYNLSNMTDSAIYTNIMGRVFGNGEDQMMAMWGVYSGKYKLLTTIPIALSSAMASSIVPSIATSMVRGEKGLVVNKIDAAIRFTMLIAIPCGIGLTALGRPILQMLFNSGSLLEETVLLMCFSVFTVTSFSLSTITNSVLQGIDRMKIPIKNAAISLGVHIIILPIILIVFKLDIYGVVLADCIFAFVICMLNDKAIRRYSGYKMKTYKVLFLPLVASIIMGLVASIMYDVANMAIKSNTICTSFAIVIAIPVYAVTLILLRVVDEEMLLNMPKGAMLVKIVKKCKLL